MSKENPTHFQKNMLSNLKNGIMGANAIEQILEERQINSFPLGDADLGVMFTADEQMARMIKGGNGGSYNELVYPLRGGKRIKSKIGKELADGVIESLKDIDYTYELKAEVEGEIYG